MIDVPVYDMSGKQTGSVQVDEQSLGGEVRIDLLKQAIVLWRTNQRQASARTKSRGMIVGSTHKLYRQKGTGNARAGARRTVVRRGGGVAFAKRNQNFTRKMPRKMKRLARNSALLAKLQAGSVAVVDPLEMEAPKTKTLFGMLKAIGGDNGCLLALDAPNETVVKSGRNVPRVEIRQVEELNAYEVLRRKKVVFTRAALEAVTKNPDTYRVEKEQ